MPTLTNYDWDPVDDCVMAETNAAGDTIVTYTHAPGQFGPLLSEHRATGWAGLSVDGWSEMGADDWGNLDSTGEAEYYHHYDALGSTTFLTDDTGTITDTFQYDAWGNQVSRTGAAATPYKWAGKWRYQSDAPTGGYYVRARIYQPAIARWTSTDALFSMETLFADASKVSPVFSMPATLRINSVTSYVYCSTAPQFNIDPSGLISDPCQPQCGTRCGPEIGNRLPTTLALLSRKFYQQNYFTRQAWCHIAGAWGQLDIEPECWERADTPRCGQCFIGQSPNIQRCVQVFGVKHNQWDVNYALWGGMASLCGMSLGNAILYAKVNKLLKSRQCGFQYTDTLVSFITAGWKYLNPERKTPLSISVPHYDNPNFDACKTCPEGYPTPPTPCAFRWFYGYPVTP